MALIPDAIGDRAFELVGRRIAEILATEVLEQFVKTGNEALDIKKVFYERAVPFHDEEHPAVNVVMAGGTYEMMTQESQQGVYTFHIDCYANSPSVGDDRGDELAAVKLKRLLGVCHYILSDWRYTTLGFAPPFIAHRSVSEILLAEPEPDAAKDAVNGMKGRLIFKVHVPEKNKAVAPVDLKEFGTTAYLGESEFGYYYGPSEQE